MESRGEKLKKIRLEKGLSLEEVQKKTKIHLNILKALEGDSLTNLSPIYLKGFLKIYCKFLGIDPKEYIPDYKETQNALKIANINRDISAKPRKALRFLKTASLKLGSFRPPKEFKRAFVFVLIIILLSLGLFNLGKFISSKRSKPGLTQGKVSAPLEHKREGKKEKKLQKAPATLQKEMISGITLVIRARQNCWLSLKVDGKLVFQRVLEKGRFENWQAKDKMELSLGNAGAVELEVNGQLFSNLGRRGQPVKNILITKEGLSIGR